jgi:hypothetical protein
MQLSSFIKKQNIKLSKDYYKLCEEGIKIMKNSVDINHNAGHVFRMLSELDKLLTYEKEIKKEIVDFEILIPSICWHDIWKTGRKQTTNFIILLLEQQYESIGSLLIFNNFIRKKKIMYKKANTIAKNILFHSEFDLLPPLAFVRNKYLERNLELKILRDLDVLDSGPGRVKAVAGHYMKKRPINPLLFRVAYLWVSRSIANIDKIKFNFKYSERRFDKVSEATINEMIKILKELMDNKEHYFDVNNIYYRYVENFKPNQRELELIKRYG